MKICITTVVDKNYREYIPFFEWCLSKSYPQYDTKIFIKETSFIGYPECGHNTIALRFLTGCSPFSGDDYVYITDIDMMILPEKIPLHKFHLDEMAKTGLSYSNSLRNKHHWMGTKSLTGLHFCSVEWFDQVEQQAKKYRLEVGAGPVRREYDGWMLYQMCRDSGLKLPGKYKLVPRHHGIHLGNFRLFEDQKKLDKRMDAEKCRIWWEYIQDPKYLEMVSKCKDKVIANRFGQLRTHCIRMLGKG